MPREMRAPVAQASLPAMEPAFDQGSLGNCELEDCETEAVRLPRLADLLLDDETGRSHRRVGPAAGFAFGIDDIDKMIDCRLFASMPFFEEKTSGRAQVFH